MAFSAQQTCIQCSQHLATYFRSSVTTMWPVQLQPSLRNQAVGTPAITIKGHKLQESHLAVSACCGTLGKCQVYTYYNIYIIYIINYYIYNHTIQYHTSILYSRYEMRGGSLDECQLSSLSDSNASSQKYSSTCNLLVSWLGSHSTGDQEVGHTAHVFVLQIRVRSTTDQLPECIRVYWSIQELC